MKTNLKFEIFSVHFDDIQRFVPGAQNAEVEFSFLNLSLGRWKIVQNIPGVHIAEEQKIFLVKILCEAEKWLKIYQEHKSYNNACRISLMQSPQLWSYVDCRIILF